MPPCDVTPARSVVFEQLGAGGRDGEITWLFSKIFFFVKRICTECVGLLHIREFVILQTVKVKASSLRGGAALKVLQLGTITIRILNCVDSNYYLVFLLFLIFFAPTLW